MTDTSPRQKLNLYLESSAGGLPPYLLEECLTLLVGWVPTLLGVVLRAVVYRLLIRGRGLFMMESGVRVRGMKFITIDGGVYLDQGVYLHGRPGGLIIGAGTRLMHRSVLHGYNFRELENSGITIGKNCVIGIGSVITGQGRVEVEDDVIIGPGVLIMPIDHRFGDTERPIREQGITARGVRLEAGCWIGAGAIILDGVTVGKGAVVGAGAVVISDVPPRSLAAGNPAQVIKKLGEGV